MPAKPAPTTTTSSSVVLSSSTITVTPLVRRACRPLATSVASVTHAGRRPSTDRSIVSRCDQTRSEVATAEQLIGHHVAEQRGVLGRHRVADDDGLRSEEHTSELQSLMRISYAVFCSKKKNTNKTN